MLSVSRKVIKSRKSYNSMVVLVVKNLPAHIGDLRDVGLILRLGRSPGGGHDNPLQVFLPAESLEQRSLAGYSPQGCKESDMTEATEHAYTCDFEKSK